MTRPVDVLPEITPEMSPMMRQYLQIKKQYRDSVLFFRLGDFYEMFYNDAEVVSEELDLVLTKRASGESEKAPMCGVPYHSSESYIARLIKKGYRVAICEQTEEASKAKKLVNRDVVRVITPGTVTEESMLEDGKNNYICSIFAKDSKAGIAFADVSTGQLHISELNSEKLEAQIINEVSRFCPSEVLVNDLAFGFYQLQRIIKDKFQGRIEEINSDTQIDFDRIYKHFKVNSFEELGIQTNGVTCYALSYLMQFLFETQKNELNAINTVECYSENQFMRLDISTRNNLELVETMRSHDKKGSLLWVLDHTKTPMGRRLIRNWIELPLLSPVAITKRQNAVAELVTKHEIREELNSSLRDIKDLERLMTRILYGTANAKELVALASTLDRMPRVRASLKGVSSALLNEVYSNIDELEDLKTLIFSSIVDEPPFSVREGGIIRDGFNEQVDAYRSDMTGGKDIVAELELREQDRTGNRKLRIKYNRIFGYYIEIPNNSAGEIPEEYIRRQTLANCERYITQEVKDLESRILGASDKLVALEYDLFVQIRNQAANSMERIKKTANAVATLDTLWSFATTAYNNNYVCPDITLDDSIEITDGRHPVVDLISESAFVSNDTRLDCKDNRCAIITGPNMAGKSTYMRQTAIITLMAQIGSFVPAKSAKIGIVDAIFTRVGASDDLSTGQSTFMVEMSEVANILKNATNKSLLIIDEIGRGTSTYDGMAIARAVLEFVASGKRIGAKTLFATHYHELTALEGQIDGVKNYNIAAKKRGDDIIFLRRIVRGGADDSYGIEVAKLAGVPQEVVSRAKQILTELEACDVKRPQKVQELSEPDMFSLESAVSNSITEELKNIDINTLTPIEALQVLFELNKKAKNL